MRPRQIANHQTSRLNMPARDMRQHVGIEIAAKNRFGMSSLCYWLLVFPIRRHRFKQHVDQLLAVEAVGLSGVVAGDAVPQGRFGHGLHVGRRRVISAVENRPGLGGR